MAEHYKNVIQIIFYSFLVSISTINIFKNKSKYNFYKKLNNIRYGKHFHVYNCVVKKNGIEKH